MYRLRLVFDVRGLPDTIFHHELLQDVSVPCSIGSHLSVAYLPALAGHPTSGLLPIRRDLDGVFLQHLTVGMDGYMKPGKFHYAVKATPHTESRYERG